MYDKKDFFLIMKYNSFYKSYIGSLDHDDLYEKVIANILGNIR